MKKVRNIVLFAVITLIFGCAGDAQRVGFDMSLERVERPENIEKRFGKIKEPVINNECLLFEDNFIEATFTFNYNHISILLVNVSRKHTIKVNWDNAIWTDIMGSPYRVLHSGTSSVDKNIPQVPSVITTNKALMSTIVPSNHARRAGTGWYCEPLFHNTSIWTINMRSELQKAQKYVGKTCSILLPLTIEGIQNDYTFIFRINDAMVVDRHKDL